MPSFAWSSDVCSRSEEHTSELQSHSHLVCRLLLVKRMLFRSDRKSPRLNSSQPLISSAVFVVTVTLLRWLSRVRTFAAFLLLNFFFFFFNDTATTEIYTLSLHDALPIYSSHTLISYAVFCLREESVTG